MSVWQNVSMPVLLVAALALAAPPAIAQHATGETVSDDDCKSKPTVDEAVACYEGKGTGTTIYGGGDGVGTTLKPSVTEMFTVPGGGSDPGIAVIDTSPVNKDTLMNDDTKAPEIKAIQKFQ